MESIVITAPPAVASKLADSLHHYFNVDERFTQDPNGCKIELAGHDGSRKVLQLVCCFMSTEKIADVVTLFWFKYRALFRPWYPYQRPNDGF